MSKSTSGLLMRSRSVTAIALWLSRRRRGKSASGRRLAVMGPLSERMMNAGIAVD